MDKNTIACCANCKHCLEYPRGNRYGDIDYMCAINGYFMHSINKDISKLSISLPAAGNLNAGMKGRKQYDK